MSRQEANAAFARTSFLDGGNAPFIEDLYGRYEADPKTVDAEWSEFFDSLRDNREEVARFARGPSWRNRHWPQLPHDELTAALDADWREFERGLGDKLKAKAQAAGAELSAAEVQQAARDSVRALMLIRAYRARGHF